MRFRNHEPCTRRLGRFIALFALIVAAGCGGNSGGRRPVAASVSGTIRVGTAPSAIAVDSTTDKIYVTDFGTQPTFDGSGCSASGADVRAIDGATQQSIASVGLWLAPQNPFAMTLNPSNHTLYLFAEAYWSGPGHPVGCGPFLNRVDAFDTTTFRQTSSAASCCNFTSGQRIDVNPSTGNLYEAGLGGNQVALIDFSSGGVLAKIPVGSNPVGIAANATTNKIYVANNGSNNISVIDRASNSVVTTITDPNAIGPVAVAVGPTTNTIYVANSQSNNLTVIDGATDSVTATIPVGASPSGVAVDPQTNFIYVASSGNSQAGNPGNVTVINGVTNTIQTLTDPKAVSPVAVAVNSVTNKIYVANSGSNNVTVLDGARE